MNKRRIGILFGGRSAEHEVSIQSARNVVNALSPDKYEVVLIGIDRKGTWFLGEGCRELLEGDVSASLPESTDGVTLVSDAGAGALIRTGSRSPVEAAAVGRVDVIFPVLHGPYGEDGSVQGLLKQANVPFVGAGVLGSAVGMDKDVMKRLLRDAGIPVPGFVSIRRSRRGAFTFRQVTDQLGSPIFVKPANMGSSVGISKVGTETAFRTALDAAFAYDEKAIIEEAIKGREIECSVLGNEDPIASIPGEIVPSHDFYSYEAKYLDEDGATLIIPADLSSDMVAEVQRMAIHAFQTLCCEGMARVDFFLQPDGKLLANEINTIPGFTRISMYPKLWEASGISPTELVDRLIDLAVERHEREQKLKTHHDL